MTIFLEILLYSLFIFIIGSWGLFFNRRNLIISLISIELLLASINIMFITISLALDDFIGQLFALFILTIAAAEAAIGLAIVIVFYRLKGTISTSFRMVLKT